jgi:hypothetical protein
MANLVPKPLTFKAHGSNIGIPPPFRKRSGFVLWIAVGESTAGLRPKRDVQPIQMSLKTPTTVLRPREGSCNGIKEDVEDVRRAGFELVKVIFNSCASKKCPSPSRAPPQLFIRFVDHDLGDLSSPVR